MKRKLIILPLLLALSVSLHAQFALKENSSNYDSAITILLTGDIKKLESPLSEISLGFLSNEECRILRNMIYASKGYIFNSAVLKKYFSAYDWYVPKYKNVDKFLSATDTANIELLKQFEQRSLSGGECKIDFKKSSWVLKENFDGNFIPQFEFASNDNSFEFSFPGKSSYPVCRVKGNYSIEENTLKLSVSELTKKYYLVALDYTDYDSADFDAAFFSAMNKPVKSSYFGLPEREFTFTVNSALEFAFPITASGREYVEKYEKEFDYFCIGNKKFYRF